MKKMSVNTNELSAADYRAMVDRKDPALFKPDKPEGPEHIMQCEIVADFRKDHPDYAGLLFAIPNGGKLPYYKNKEGKYTSPQRIKLSKEGLMPGIPDLQLAVARGEWHGLFCELKILPNQPSDEQRAFMERATRQGYYCIVCYTREQARELFNNYLNLQPKVQHELPL